MTDSPLYARLHEFMLWLLPMTLKLPRVHRFVLAQNLQRLGFSLQGHLMQAARSGPAEPSLRRADACLLELRANLRLAHDLELISAGQYETGSRHCVEIGRLIGAWLKRS